MIRLRRWWWLVPPALLVALVWPERHFVPMWDGNVYLQCVIDAAQQGLSAHSLRCGGHHSQLYMGLLALAERAAPGSTVAIVTVNLILAVAALGAFAALLRRLAPGDDWWAERALLVTVLAAHPLIGATLVQLNPDFGLYAFFLITLALLLWQRYPAAALSGLMLCFAKETGALAFGVMLALHALFRCAGGTGPATTRCRAIAREMAPAVLPLVAYAAFLGWWAATQSGYFIWNGGIHERPLTGIHWFDFEDVTLRSYAAIIFVLGFAWVATAVVVADLAVGAMRTAARRGDRALTGLDARASWFIVVLFAVLTYLLTAYRTWSFPRYFAVLAPLLLVVGFISLVRLGAGPSVRRVALGALALVLLSANWTSSDPVSRMVFGSLPVGERSLYQVAGIARDFRALATDHLCYNLEFTGLHDAFNSAFAGIRPTESTYVVFPRTNRWGLWSPLDPRSFARVARRTGVVMPRYADEVMIAVLRDQQPRDLWLLEQPTDADTLARAMLHRSYADSGASRYTARGVTIAVRHMVRFGARPLP
ncbi:MAG TPA: hypothetical protein VHE78_18610 [Gemmatimonadaceae bacterium]|nr:hypothetical protein [Gemmatimonadaceae bacterium]